ncbi:hypothetical protein DUNSADRAFT_15900 [Dunaliella salina]|uniref:Encoded protein n=1 Tax=Dunaliella salina TaxID=3046 RepID=A0ABQ7G4M6_DUNSA|nr:hypothetical protein DUNSADRAFT_15900 [Dunaliella salina]|eukprot:KAF5829560.1 hypothetical protein DUNSADRAFT_15900 [Dunaliella salina]
MTNYSSIIGSVNQPRLAEGERTWALRLLTAAEARNTQEEIKILRLAKVKVRGDEGPPTIEDTVYTCDKVGLLQAPAYARQRYQIPQKVLDVMSPFGTLHVFDSWVPVAERQYTSAVYLVYLLMHCRAGVCVCVTN